MVNSKLKNIIVLKGMASNVVQEAIVILKPNIDLQKSNFVCKNKDNNVCVDRKKSIVAEAEYVIENYIEKIEKRTEWNIKNRIEKKYKCSKVLNIILAICLIISLL